MKNEEMKIRLKETIIDELWTVVCRPGDEIKVESFLPATGAAFFTKRGLAVPQNCVVYPEDYEVVES